MDFSRPSLRIWGIEKPHWTTVLLIVLLWLLSFPAPAAGGYDIAHIVERTCEPGGPLIVTDEWKRPQDRNRVITEPGEVIVCPRVGPTSSFQIAAGPERIGREPYLCTYFSLLNGDGADTCLALDSADGAGSLVKPLMTIRAGRSGRLAVAGIASDDVARIAVRPRDGGSWESTVVLIDGPRAARLGAPRAFAYFSLPVDRPSLCAEQPTRLLGRDSSGRRVAQSAVQISTPLLDATDRVPHSRSLKALCREGDEESRERSAARASAGGGGGGDAVRADADLGSGSSSFIGLRVGGIAVFGLLLIALGLVSVLRGRAGRDRAARRTP